MTTDTTASTVTIKPTVRDQRGTSPWARDMAAFVRNPLAMTGSIILLGIILVAVFAPLIAPFPKGYGTAEEILQPPSAAHWFGTDDLGLDIFGEVVWGARVTIIIGLLASGLALLIGVPIGLLGGFYKGKTDGILTGLTDVFLSLPMLPLMILMAAVLGPSLGNTALVIGLVSWPQMARVIRGQTFSTVGQPFVEAAVSVGCNTGRLLRRHTLPAAVPVLVVNVLLIMSRAILSEAGLSFSAWATRYSGRGARSCRMRR